jgi:lysozyme
MRTSDKAKEMIKHHEGVRNRPYLCPAKLWTVGVGHVLYPEQGKLKLEERGRVTLRDADNRVWSMEEVDALLNSDLARFERGVARLCPNSALAQNHNHFDALVSFAFNVGLGNLQNSGLRFKYNRGEYDYAANEFLKWTKGGGKILPGLVKRRNDERNLFLGRL